MIDTGEDKKAAELMAKLQKATGADLDARKSEQERKREQAYKTTASALFTAARREDPRT